MTTLVRAAGRLLLPPIALLLAACPHVTVRPGEQNPEGLEGLARKVVNLTLDHGKGEILDMATDLGDIRVRVAEDRPSGLVATLALRGRTDEEAADAIERYTIVTEHIWSGLTLELAGDPLIIRREDGSEIEQTPSFDLDATVPRRTSLRLSTRSGNIVLEGPFGEVRARTGLGDVEVRGAYGTVDLRSSKGDIEVSGVREGRLVLDTSIGDIAAEGVFRTLEARTSTGTVRVEARRGSLVERGWRLHSSTGDVHLTLPVGISCRVTAETSIGTIRSDLAGGRRIEAGGGGGTYEARVGGGGEEILLGASSGDVRIRVGE
jgi:hypothetical protein